MKNILISSIFFLIAAILFSVKYIVVSIFLAKSDSLNSDLISETLKTLPVELAVTCWMAFLIGIIFFILGIIKERKKNQ